LLEGVLGKKVTQKCVFFEKKSHFKKENPKYWSRLETNILGFDLFL
jgi:hypothetical protein